MILLAAFLCMIALGRLAWMMAYFYYYRKRHGKLVGSLKATRVLVLMPRASRDEALKTHGLYIAAAQRQLDTCLLGGTLGITAWSALYIVHTNAGFEISAFSLTLLFVGVIVLIAGPALAKGAPLFFSYTVRESALYVGFGAVVFSLSSIAWDLSGLKGGVPMAVISFVYVLGEFHSDVVLVGQMKDGISGMPPARPRLKSNSVTLRSVSHLLARLYPTRKQPNAECVSQLASEVIALGYSIDDLRDALKSSNGLAEEFEKVNPPTFTTVGIARTALAIADKRYDKLAYPDLSRWAWANARNTSQS